MTSWSAFESAWDLLHAHAHADSPGARAALRNRRRDAADRVAAVPHARIAFPLAAVSLDRLRTNVYALVAPQLVRSV